MKQVLLYRRDSISDSDVKRLEALGLATVALTTTDASFIPHVIGVYSDSDCYGNAAQGPVTTAQTH